MNKAYHHDSKDVNAAVRHIGSTERRIIIPSFAK